MTNALSGQKICPVNLNRCNCQKGECAIRAGVAYSQVQQQEHTHDWQIWPESDGQDQRCNICFKFRKTPKEDMFWLQEQKPQAVTGEAQADALEAHSLKYHHCAQVFQLTSGKFALFGAYSRSERSPMGIPLIAIGTWEELRPHVEAYRKTADEQESRPARTTSQKPSLADYDNLFGDE